MSPQFPAPQPRRAASARRSWRPPASAATSPTTWSRSAGRRTGAGTTRRCCRTGRCCSTRPRWCCTTGRRSSRGSRPTASPTARSRRSVPRPTRRGSARRLAAGDGGAARGAVPRLARRAARRRPGVGAAAGGDESMYLRPFMIASEVGLGVRPSGGVPVLLIASPAGAVLPGRGQAGRRVAHTEYTRAALGGTGTAKCGGQLRRVAARRRRRAPTQGCAQVVYLDAEERRWVDEMGVESTCSSCTARAARPRSSPRSSPAASCAGVTRDSLLVLAKELGCAGRASASISGDEWREGAADGAHHRGVRLRHGGGRSRPIGRDRATRAARCVDRRRRARSREPAAAGPAHRRSSAARRPTPTPGCAPSCSA